MARAKSASKWSDLIANEGGGGGIVTLPVPFVLPPLIGPVKTFHQKSRAPRASNNPLPNEPKPSGSSFLGCLGAVGALDGSFRLLFRIQTPMPQGGAHATSGGTFLRVLTRWVRKYFSTLVDLFTCTMPGVECFRCASVFLGPGKKWQQYLSAGAQTLLPQVSRSKFWKFVV